MMIETTGLERQQAWKQQVWNMSDALIPSAQPRHSPALGGGFFAVFVASLAAGCVLFVVDRKLTWGLEEPLFNAWLLWFAFIPLCVYAVLALALPPSPYHHDLPLVRYGRLSSVWLASLVLYAAAQMATLSRWIDDPIYEAFGLSLTSFALLTAIYVTASFAAVWAIEAVWRRDRESGRDGNSREVTRRMEMILGATMCLPMFLLFVFYLPV
jgi:hypothetical protein